jgi:3-oxoacyl-[acyl-carrier-protein] synthase II
MRRVVVTGLGMVTPLACGVEETWTKLLAGESGLGKITRFDASEISCKIAGEVTFGEGVGEFNADAWVDRKSKRQMDLFTQYAMAATAMAVKDSGIFYGEDAPEEEMKRTGVLVGSGIGGLPEIDKNVPLMKEKGWKKLSPFFLPSILINIASGHISMKYGFRGPNHSVVTACATGGHAIGDAARMIAFDDADVMIAGSGEGTITPIAIGGFAACRALSTRYNDDPTAGSRPWDKGRDGFVMGEGAGILVLEEYEHAVARGAKIYGEIVGYGLSGDAYHITSPHPEGRGGYDAMVAALKRSGLNTGDIDYINAHGTSTPMGDMIEFGAVKRLFGADAGGVSMSSTKSAIGHLLGGAGSVEAIFALLAMRDGVCPPTLNLHNPDEGCEGMDLVPHIAKERKVDAVLSNSFGFGGTNVSLVMKKV